MSTEFEHHLRDLLRPIGQVTLRRMFGGIGVYLDERFFALGIDEVLYFKTDELTRKQFQDAGSQPFVYDNGKRQVEVGYWTVPEEALDDPAAMRPWAELALAAAGRAAAAKAAREAKRRTRTPAAKARPRSASRPRRRR